MTATRIEPIAKNLFNNLRNGVEIFSPQQKLVCAYILENYSEVAFMTVEDLAEASGTSPATVVRTISSLGYKGFHEMLEEIQKLLVNTKTSLWWQLEQSWEDSADIRTKDPLNWVTQDNIVSLRNSLTPSLVSNFNKAVEMLAKAKNISILGLRSSKGAALFFYSLLHQFLPNTCLVDPSGADEMFANILDLSNDDVLFAMSLGGPHYAVRTIQALELAHRRKVPTILLTSDMAGPAIAFSDTVLCVAPTKHHYSLVPVMNILDAFIVELGSRKKHSANSKLRSLEEILKEIDVTL